VAGDAAAGRAVARVDRAVPGRRLARVRGRRDQCAADVQPLRPTAVSRWCPRRTRLAGAVPPGSAYAAGVAVLIDPPLWPAHGTTFAHLVSDVSLAELHAFAESAGLSERAFDRDHYDVPAGRHEELVRRGAEPVSGGELIRRLRASGLRVTARERPEHARETLRVRWPEPLRAAEALRDELLDRWSEPHRHYHDSTHLLAVLDALVRVADGPVPLPVELAAWFHDAVYEG